MRIVVNVSRLDLVRFNFLALFRIRGNWIMFLLFWVAVILSFLSKNGWGLPAINPILALVISLSVAALAFLTMFTFMMIWTTLSVTEKSGIIGSHTLTVEDDGIREQTIANDSLHRWEAIQDMRIAGNMAMIRLNQYMFFLIPKRGLDDPRAFETFCNAVRSKLEAAT